MARRSFKATLATAGLISGGIASIALAAPASAAPGNCHLTQALNSASAVCTTGSGQDRVVAVCEDPQHGTDSTYYGAWVGPGSTSVVNCPRLGGYQWYEVAAKVEVR